MRKTLPNVMRAVFVITVIVFASAYVRDRTCMAEIGTEPKPFIMTAFQEETDAVLRQASSVSVSCSSRGIEYTRANFGNQEAVVFEGGVGPGDAARSARRTLDKFAVERLIFSGVAGAVQQDGLSIGDTIVAKSWIDGHRSTTLEADQKLLANAASIGGVRVVDRGITADHFMKDISSIPKGTAIVDMESYAVAKIARDSGVPFLSVRSISDHVGSLETIELEKPALASARVVYELLQLPME